MHEDDGGSLFSGIGGLDRAVELAAGIRPRWFCENDPAARRVLARHYPGVDIYPDVRELAADAPRVGWLHGGYPCQPFSHAGLRKGELDERHLWPEFARLIRVLRPRRVVLENVAGHLALGFGSVLADVAAMGYRATWGCIRASDAGAPHRRERVFVVATDADAGPERGERAGESDALRRGGAATDTGRERSHGRRGTNTSGASRRGSDGRAEPTRPLVSTADAVCTRREGLGDEPRSRPGEEQAHGARASRRAALADAGRERDESGLGRRAPGGGHAWAEQTQRDGRRHDGPAERRAPVEVTTDADGGRREGEWQPGAGGVGRARRPVADGRDEAGSSGQPAAAWGPYAPAIARWERILRRPAPRPTDDRGRLEPRFVEWLMGFDDDHTAGETRTARLRLLGNAVCPQQGALAVRTLLALDEAHP